jgi:ketosteroid isomerase-like protein
MKAACDGWPRPGLPGARRGGGTVGACLALLLAALLPATRAAGQPPAEDADIAAIRSAAAAYREALARGDAATIRAAWTADGDLVDSFGAIVPAADLAAAGDQPATPPAETRLRLITPDVALEDGSFEAIVPGLSRPLAGSFTAVWVRAGDAWKLAGVRESERPVVADASSLDDLDWLVGDWVLVPDDGLESKEAGSMEMTVRWDAARTFLIREARLTPPVDSGEPVVELEQRIGWDPLVGRIRSWSFSTDGSRAEATWFRDGQSWIVRGASVLPDGTQAGATNIYTFDGADRCLWQVVRPPLGSDPLPTRATWVRKARSTAQ